MPCTRDQSAERWVLAMSDVQFLKEDKPAKPMTTTPGEPWCLQRQLRR